MTIINTHDPWETPTADKDLAAMSIDSLFRLVHELESRIHARGVLITEKQRQNERLLDQVEAQGRALQTAQATVQHLLKAAKGRPDEPHQRSYAGGKQFNDPVAWEREHLARKERDG